MDCRSLSRPRRPSPHQQKEGKKENDALLTLTKSRPSTLPNSRTRITPSPACVPRVGGRQGEALNLKRLWGLDLLQDGVNKTCTETPAFVCEGESGGCLLLHFCFPRCGPLINHSLSLSLSLFRRRFTRVCVRASTFVLGLPFLFVCV